MEFITDGTCSIPALELSTEMEENEEVMRLVALRAVRIPTMLLCLVIVSEYCVIGWFEAIKVVCF